MIVYILREPTIIVEYFDWLHILITIVTTRSVERVRDNNNIRRDCVSMVIMRSNRNINDFYIDKKQMAILIAVGTDKQLLIELISNWQMWCKMICKINHLVILLVISLAKDTFSYLQVELTIIIYLCGIMNCEWKLIK